VAAIFTGVRGYLDKIDVGRVGAFEAQFIAELKAKDPGILEAIRTQLEIKPDIEKKLTTFLDGFAKTFS
jgi:F-type H+-transporting ATPase subunit alpha